jgi:hypothetical protein
MVTARWMTKSAATKTVQEFIQTMGREVESKLSQVSEASAPATSAMTFRER